MPTLAVRAEPARDEVLSPAELSAAIEKFSEPDWLRVKKAVLRFYGRCGGDWEVLQNEALVRALDGRRKCRKDVGVVTFLGNAIRSIASERDGLDFERNVSWTDPAKQIREKIARMDDLFMDDLFSVTGDELLQEATEQGIDVSAVGGAGRAAFERVQVLVGRKPLALVGRGMAEDAGRPPAAMQPSPAIRQMRVLKGAGIILAWILVFVALPLYIARWQSAVISENIARPPVISDETMWQYGRRVMDCNTWTDDCSSCQRIGTTEFSCSNVSIACVQREIRCTGARRKANAPK
jgi:hypothetical protein